MRQIKHVSKRVYIRGACILFCNWTRVNTVLHKGGSSTICPFTSKANGPKHNLASSERKDVLWRRKEYGDQETVVSGADGEGGTASL
jgi:hypothetical protein